MFITPNNQGDTFNEYDPLVTGYLTQNQMGYLPNAGFMTPASYGSFRTLPAANFVTNQEMNPSLFQSFLIANQGMGLVNTYNPASNNLRREIYAQRRLGDAATSIGIGASTTLASVAAGAAIGGIPGIIVGAGVGVVADTIGSAYIDRLRTTRDIQQATMSRITYGKDVAAGLGQGFSMTAARKIDRSIRAQAASDPFFDREDYDTMFKVGLDSGMFDMSNSADQYIQTFKKLKGNLKLMMSLFETADFRELGNQMQRMQAMGVSIQDMSSISVQEKTAARMLGISHNDAISMYGQQGALISNGLGLSGILGSSVNLSVAGRLEAARRAGILTAQQWSALGGVSGASQTITSKQLNTVNRNDILLPLMGYLAKDGDISQIDTAKWQQLIKGDINLSDFNRGIGTLNNVLSVYGPDKGVTHINTQASTFLDRLVKETKSPEALMAALIGSYKMTASKMNISFDSYLRTLGFSDKELQALYSSYSLEARTASMANTNKSLRDIGYNNYMEFNPGLFRRMRTFMGKTYNDVSEFITGNFIEEKALRDDLNESIKSGSYINTNINDKTIDLSKGINHIFKYDRAEFLSALASTGAKYDASLDGVEKASKDIRKLNELFSNGNGSLDDVVNILYDKVLGPTIKEELDGHSSIGKKASLKKIIEGKVDARFLKLFLDGDQNAVTALIHLISNDLFYRTEFIDKPKAIKESYKNYYKLSSEDRAIVAAGVGKAIPQKDKDKATVGVKKEYAEQMARFEAALKAYHIKEANELSDESQKLLSTIGIDKLDEETLNNLLDIQNYLKTNSIGNYGAINDSYKNKIKKIPGVKSINYGDLLPILKNANIQALRNLSNFHNNTLIEGTSKFALNNYLYKVLDQDIIDKWRDNDNSLDIEKMKQWYSTNKDKSPNSDEVKFAHAILSGNTDALREIVSADTYRMYANYTEEGRNALESSSATNELMGLIGTFMDKNKVAIEQNTQVNTQLVNVLDTLNKTLGRIDTTLLRVSK